MIQSHRYHSLLALSVVVIAMLSACRAGGSETFGYIEVRLSIACVECGDGVLLSVESAVIQLSGDTPMDAVEVDGSFALIVVPEGVWDVFAVGVIEQNNLHVSGSAVGVAVTASSTVPVSIDLTEIQSGVTRPDGPTGLTASATSTSVTLNWIDASSNEDLFVLERALVSGDYSGATVFEIGVDVAGYTDLEVLEATTYYYRVKASNDAGDSGYSNEATATVSDDPLPPLVPAAPTNLVANGSIGAVNVSWLDNSDNETQFVLERSETPGNFAEGLVVSLPFDTTGYEDTSVAGGTNYYYRAKAVNSQGASTYSNEDDAYVSLPTGGAIVADHTVIDLYDDIPAVWITEVKQMFLSIPGESHGRGYIYGLELLEALDSTYSVSATWGGTPEGPSGAHLRVSRSYWSGSGWWNSGGEEDFWTNAGAVAMMKSHLDYMRDTAANPVGAFGFAWCWDMSWINSPAGGVDPVYGVRWAGSTAGGPDGNLRWGLDAADTALTSNSVNLTTYLTAVDVYSAHDPDTVTFFTTGPVDLERGNEAAYQVYLKQHAIRQYVADNGGVLFDYADILSWDGGVQYMDSWDGHIFPNGDPDLATYTGFDGGNGDSHISEEACLKLGKALWWMLARVAGWDGQI